MLSKWTSSSSQHLEESETQSRITTLGFDILILAVSLTSWFISRSLASRTAARDAFAFSILLFIFCRDEAFSVLLHISTMLRDVYIYIIPLLLVNALQLAYLSGLIATRSSTSTSNGCDSSPLEPLIIPSITKHTRLFPRHHSFQYSYLLVGVPVEWRGQIGTLLSCDESERQSWWRTPWFSVHAEDYLFYSRHQSDTLFAAAQAPSLRDKLNAYLLTQSIADPSSAYPHAYLVTAPRVLGFSFNPVSFWYLYDRDRCLRGMILEVNNTFGERRMYFLPEDGEIFHEDSAKGNEEEKKTAMFAGKQGTGVVAAEHEDGVKAKKFKMKWSKDFHVSPFNDREGVYSLTAVDPFAKSTRAPGTPPHMSDNGFVVKQRVRINNTITLSSPHYTTLSPSEPTPTSFSPPPLSPKIIASISSLPHQPGISPLSLSLLERICFLFRWSLSGFLTNPRIVAEARTLWAKGLKVWFRPEVYPTTIGREETPEEIILERWFRKWLEDIAKQSGVDISYSPAAGQDRGREILISAGSSPSFTVSGAAAGAKASSEDSRTNESKTHGFMNGNHAPCPSPNSHIPHSEAQSACTANFVSSSLLSSTKSVTLKVLTPLLYTSMIRSPSFLQLWHEHAFGAKDGNAMVFLSEEDKVLFHGMVERYLHDFNENRVGSGHKEQGYRQEDTKKRNPGRDQHPATIALMNEDLRNRKSLLSTLIKGVFRFLSPPKRTSLTEQGQKKAMSGNRISFADIAHALPLPSPFPSTASATLAQRSREFEVASFRVLTADRLTLGSTAVLDFLITMVRYSLLVWVAHQLSVLLKDGVGVFQSH